MKTKKIAIVEALVVVLVVLSGVAIYCLWNGKAAQALSYFVDTEEGGVEMVRIVDDKTGQELCTAETGKNTFDSHQIAHILMRYRCQIFKDLDPETQGDIRYLFLPQNYNKYLVTLLSEKPDNRLADVTIEYGYGALKNPFDIDLYAVEEFSVARPDAIFRLASNDGSFFIYSKDDGLPYNEHSTTTYSLYDSSGQVLLSNFHQSHDKRSVFFDPYNYGFLFIDVTPAAMTDDQYGRRKFTYSYLTLYDTPAFRTLETHEDEVNVDGKGCSLIAEFHPGFVVLESCAAPIRAPGNSSSLIVQISK